MSDESEPEAESSYFGRPMTEIPDGGSLGGDLRRAISYPRTMTSRTFLGGGIAFAASLLYLGAPLALGYQLTAARRAASDEPAPTFDQWYWLFGRGLGYAVLASALVFLSVVLAAVVSVFFEAIGLAPSSTEMSDSVAAFLVLWLVYTWPWIVGVYGARSWREFARPRSWRWLVTLDYAATVLVAAVIALGGYLVTGLSVITIVGWPFVGFYVMTVFSVFTGQRYRDWLVNGGAETGVLASIDTGVFESVAQRIRSIGDGVSATGASTPTAETSTSSGSSTVPSTENAVDGADESTDDEFPDRARRIEGDGHITVLERDEGERGLRLESDDPDARESFEGTVQVWQSLDGTPEVTAVTESGSDPRPWVAFDAGDGPLTAFGGDLADDAVLAVLNDVAEALATGRMYNHAHGDLSPACIYVTREGGTAAARQRVSATVAEWGLRRAVRAVLADFERTAYTPPELTGDGGADDAVDVYQIAAIAHYALTGRPPFEGDELGTEWEPPTGFRLPAGVTAALERGLAPAPADRYDDVSSFVRALNRALSPS